MAKNIRWSCLALDNSIRFNYDDANASIGRSQNEIITKTNAPILNVF